ncbi:hypothetical protein V2O64_24650 (plasmid) [Verrucomicrobiaceae bacterium 227]
MESADFCGVSEVTLNSWKGNHREFLKSLKEGKSQADVIALAVVGTLSWWFVKYLAPKLKVPKGSGLALFALAASLALLTPSCANLSPDQNDRLIDAAERVIIYVAK